MRFFRRSTSLKPKAISPYSRPKQPNYFRVTFLTLCAALVVESISLQLWNNWGKHTKVLVTSASHPISDVGSVEASVDSQQVDPSPTPTTIVPNLGIKTVLAAAPVTPLTSPTIIFHSPLRTYRISQYFSYYHTAIDMADPTGTPIYATTIGVVSGTGYILQGGGLMIEVTHPNGYVSYYAHLSAITSAVGQSVDNTVQIGRVGATGVATGPHLHFMITLHNQAINPLSLIQ
jgi:murein DD-endopeptidase MepM/ murein hydrolase activator NlpD